MRRGRSATQGNRWRRSLVAAIVTGLALAMAFGVAGPTGAATVVCPTAPLLSEEIGRAGSVFIGEVRAPADSDGVPAEEPLGEAVEVAVEEIWRGPELAPVVVVSNPTYAGAPRIELVTGGRYLFLAEPDSDAADDPVERLALRECSLTRGLTPDLAGLRPPDARVMPGFAPTGASDAGSPPLWPWAVAGFFILATGAAYLIRDRTGPARAWLPWATGVAAAGSVVLGAVLALGAPSGTASASPTASDGGSAEPSIEPPAAEDPRLVLRLSDAGGELGTFGRVVSIHADGRVISSTPTDAFVEQWLTADGVEAVEDEVAATGLFEGPERTSASFRAILRPGAESPQRGVAASTIALPSASGTVLVDWTPIPAAEVDLWQPSEEIAALDALAARLRDLEGWLAPDAWLLLEGRPYDAARFRLSAEEIVSGFGPRVALDDLRWPLEPPLTELPAVRNPSGLLSRCMSLSRGEASDVLGTLAEALGEPALRLHGRTMVELAGATAGRVHRLTLEPLMPDEAACAGTTPVAGPPTLAAGAIALVRVDGLRMREAPDADAAVIGALGAGERVAIVTESPAPDGSRWWLVRQGPGDRQGWVSAGPADGDPWLVPVGNGVIAVVAGNGRIRTLQPDGSGATTIADAGNADWSPDGTRILVSVPPDAGHTEWQIGVADPDGTTLRRLAEGGDTAWSPDGSRIAFVRFEDAGPSIYVIGADGGTPERVTDGWWPAWSPDGSALAVWRPDASVRPTGDGVVPIPEALVIVPLDGGDESQLTPFAVREMTSRAAWSPDGQLIASGDRLLQIDGTEVLRLDRADTWAERPWSPDGEDLIVLDTDPNTLFADGISLLSVDSGELRSVVPPGDDSLSHVTFSPDGRFLAYTAVRFTVDGNIALMEIRLVPVAGGEVTDLGVTDSQSPTWQPVVAVPLD